MGALRETGRVICPINPLAASRYRTRYAVCGAKAGRQRHLDPDVARLRNVFTATPLHQPAVVENAMCIQLTTLTYAYDPVGSTTTIASAGCA